MASNTEAEMLKQLENISFLLGDLNAIRHGEYEPPKGANREDRTVRATPDDIYSLLGTVVSLLERQNVMIYNMGLNQVDNKDFWHDQNKRA